MYCTKCGTEIADGEQICPKCGNPIGNSVKDDAKHTDEKKSHRGLIIGIAAVIVIVCIVVAIVLFLKSRSSSDDTSKNEVVEVESSESESADVESSETGSGEIGSADSKGKSDVEAFEDSTVAQIGSYVNFGRYDQDGYYENGQEPIEWEVLDIDGDKALLISRYVLGVERYTEKDADAIWETSTLRKWLNDDFLNIAFTTSEQSYIQNTHLVNDDNLMFKIEGGNDTDDSIFCLSLAEINNYYHIADTIFVYEKRQALVAQPTETLRSSKGGYTFTQDDYDDTYADHGYTRDIIGTTSVGWWLRTPGMYSDQACCVKFDGSVGYGAGCGTTCGVRPALWVSTEVLTSEYESAEANSKRNFDDSVDFSGLQVGSYVSFGGYEQDGNIMNGQEPIEWEVLDIDEDRALLISQYILDYTVYDDQNVDTTWEISSLRKWLNDVFLNTAFTSDEQSCIQSTHLINDDNPIYGTYGGADTYDRVFCLSLVEIYKYFHFTYWIGEDVGGYSQDLVIPPTDYLVEYVDEVEYLCEESRFYLDDISNYGYTKDIEGIAGIHWWLRSPAKHSSCVCVSNGFGGVGPNVDGDAFEYAGVRPALWVSLSGKATTVGAGESTDASDDGSVNPDDWELYRKVLDALVHDPESNDGLPSAPVYCSTQEVSYYSYAVEFDWDDQCFYTFYDLDGNGIDELFVSAGGMGGTPIMYYIYDDGEPDYDYIFPNDSHFHYPLSIEHYNPDNHGIANFDSEYAYSNEHWYMSCEYDFDSYYDDDAVQMDYRAVDSFKTVRSEIKDRDTFFEDRERAFPMKGEEMFAYWYVLSPESIKDADSAIPVTKSENLPNALDSK